jgi:hypothetical protein
MRASESEYRGFPSGLLQLELMQPAQDLVIVDRIFWCWCWRDHPDQRLFCFVPLRLVGIRVWPLIRIAIVVLISEQLILLLLRRRRLLWLWLRLLLLRCRGNGKTCE